MAMHVPRMQSLCTQLLQVLYPQVHQQHTIQPSCFKTRQPQAASTPHTSQQQVCAYKLAIMTYAVQCACGLGLHRWMGACGNDSLMGSATANEDGRLHATHNTSPSYCPFYCATMHSEEVLSFTNQSHCIIHNSY